MAPAGGSGCRTRCTCSCAAARLAADRTGFRSWCSERAHSESTTRPTLTRGMETPRGGRRRGSGAVAVGAGVVAEATQAEGACARPRALKEAPLAPDVAPLADPRGTRRRRRAISIGRAPSRADAPPVREGRAARVGAALRVTRAGVVGRDGRTSLRAHTVTPSVGVGRRIAATNTIAAAYAAKAPRRAVRVRRTRDALRPALRGAVGGATLARLADVAGPVSAASRRRTALPVDA